MKNKYFVVSVFVVMSSLSPSSFAGHRRQVVVPVVTMSGAVAVAATSVGEMVIGSVTAVGGALHANPIPMTLGSMLVGHGYLNGKKSWKTISRIQRGKNKVARGNTAAGEFVSRHTDSLLAVAAVDLTDQLVATLAFDPSVGFRWCSVSENAAAQLGLLQNNVVFGSTVINEAASAR
jgi:hypothetical protein